MAYTISWSMVEKAKQSKRVKYWIEYRLKDGARYREALTKFEDVNAYSIEDAKKALSKRVVQRRENKIFEIKEESSMTFEELTEWYLALEIMLFLYNIV